MKHLLILLPVLAMAGLASAATILPGQTENFQSGGLGGWSNGANAPDPTIVANGGPSGAGDQHMVVTSDGSFQGGKMTVFNRTTWAGDFSAITAIEMDLRNVATSGSDTLIVRLSLNAGTPNGSPGYVTSANVSLAPSATWTHASFPLSSLVPVNGPAALPGFLSNVAEMRIFHSTDTSNLHGQNIAGQLGIDNITAIPEPSAVWLGTLAAGWFAQRRR